MIQFLDISNHTLFWHYLASNLAYLAMLIVALKTSLAHQRRLQSHRPKWIKETPLPPQSQSLCLRITKKVPSVWQCETCCSSIIRNSR